jgi:hypothetical protein
LWYTLVNRGEVLLSLLPMMKVPGRPTRAQERSRAGELNELKREREEALRAISAAAHGLPVHLQRDLNDKLRKLAMGISETRRGAG